MRRRLTFLFMFVLSWGWPALTKAQDFSARPIRIVIGTAYGGPTDVVARLVGQKLAPALGATLIVESLRGGYFSRAFREIAKSPPDGHTLFMVSTSALVSQLLHPELGNDVLRDTSPITQVATSPLVIVVRKGLPIKSVEDLVVYAKKNPNKLSFGIPGGSGSSFYLALALLQQKTNITFNAVPYYGSNQAVGDLLGGHIDAMFDSMPTTMPYIRSGDFFALAVTSLERSPALPHVPTVAEQGIADYDVTSWFGLLAPRLTALPIRQRIRDEVAVVLKDPDVVAGLAKQGLAAVGDQSDAWHDYLKRETTRWQAVITKGKIKPEQ